MTPRKDWKPCAGRIKQGAQDRGPRNLKFPPKPGLGTPLLFSNRPQGQKNCTVRQIRPANDFLDPAQERGARNVKQHLLVVSVELTYRETTTVTRHASESQG